MTPRLVVDDVAGQVEFLRRAFDAVGDAAPDRPVELEIGDSRLMISPTTVRDAFPAFLYLYVDDADRSFRAALQAGAVALEEPFDTPYGDRRGMVRDPFGNVFQVAHPLEG